MSRYNFAVLDGDEDNVEEQHGKDFAHVKKMVENVLVEEEEQDIKVDEKRDIKVDQKKDIKVDIDAVLAKNSQILEIIDALENPAPPPPKSPKQPTRVDAAVVDGDTTDVTADDWTKPKQKKPKKKEAKTIPEDHPLPKCFFFKECGQLCGLKSTSKTGKNKKYWPYCESCFDSRTSPKRCTTTGCKGTPKLRSRPPIGTFHTLCETCLSAQK